AWRARRSASPCRLLQPFQRSLCFMWMLWLITAVWAFSFSLIGVYISPSVDSYIAVFIRMSLALLLFLPLLRLRALPVGKAVALMAIGAVQLGIMYLFLYHAFLY